MLLGESKEVRIQEHTPEWDAHRANHYNGSDAPAMMGVSKYKTRDQLLDELATGIKPEVTPQQQKIFDRGHFNEECAREYLKEKEGLVFVKSIFTNGKLSASLDGKDLVKVTHMECKSMNNDLREFFGGYATDGDTSKLDISYRIQMEQGFICNPKAEKCLFVAASFEGDGTLLEIAWCFYKPDLELQKEIIAGWEQLEQDLKTHKPTQEKAKPVVAEIAPLPTVMATVSAQVLDTNVVDVSKAHHDWIENIKPADELTTDEDFAYGEKLVKFCSEFENNCKQSKSMVLSQAASVNDVMNSLESMAETTRQVRLAYEKAIKRQKELVKSNAVLKVRTAYVEFVNKLDKDLDGCSIHHEINAPNFAGVIKGLKTLTSMESNLNDALASAKVAATQRHDEIKANLDYIKAEIKGHEHLFNAPDLAVKQRDFIELRVKTVIADENTRLEKVKLDAIEAEKAKAEQAKQQASIPDDIKTEPVITTVANAPASVNAAQYDEGSMTVQPERNDLLAVVSKHYNVHMDVAERWLIDEFGVKAA